MKHSLRMFFTVFALALAVFAAAPAFAADSLNITDLVRADPADLVAGLARAQAAGDVGFASAKCIQGVIDYNATHPQKKLVPEKPVGVVDGIVAGHLLANGLATGNVELLPPELMDACGGLALEVLRNVNRVGIRVAPKVLGLF